MSGSDGDVKLAADTGLLTVGRSLRYASVPFYNLTVAARSVHSQSDQPQAITNLRVNLIDKNTCAPTFESDPIQLFVYENLEVLPAVIGQVQAIDCDSALNAKLSYSIIQGNTTAFSIDSMSGMLSVHTVLDRELSHSHSLLIQVTDAGNIAFRKRLKTLCRSGLLINNNKRKDPAT